MLHRDVSTGNVLICPTPDVNSGETVGNLIDLEYSKQSDKRVEYPAPNVSEPSVQRMIENIRYEHKVSVVESAARILIARYPAAKDYLRYVEVALDVRSDPITTNEEVIYIITGPHVGNLSYISAEGGRPLIGYTFREFLRLPLNPYFYSLLFLRITHQPGVTIFLIQGIGR